MPSTTSHNKSDRLPIERRSELRSHENANTNRHATGDKDKTGGDQNMLPCGWVGMGPAERR
jgi:hypothetical protein